MIGHGPTCRAVNVTFYGSMTDATILERTVITPMSQPFPLNFWSSTDIYMNMLNLMRGTCLYIWALIRKSFLSHPPGWEPCGAPGNQSSVSPGVEEGTNMSPFRCQGTDESATLLGSHLPIQSACFPQSRDLIVLTL